MAKDPNKPGRIGQIIKTYQLTKQVDPKLTLILAGTFVATAAVVFCVLFFALFHSLVFPIIFAILFGLLAGLMVFARRAQASAIAQVEGQPGAAASVLGMLRRGWKVEPMVAFNRQQDLITRVVGPPGIVLVGEGNPNRLKPLMASEHKKHERVASETPIHEVYVGDGDGQVPLRKLTRHVTKLGRELKPAQMTDVLQRLRALDANRSNIPMPKGPMPTSMKGQRGNLRGR